MVSFAASPVIISEDIPGEVVHDNIDGQISPEERSWHGGAFWARSYTQKTRRDVLTSVETQRLLKRVLELEPNETGSTWTIREDSRFRNLWNLLMFPILIYIGTVMPYRLCFVEFHVVQVVDTTLGWQVVEIFMEVIFVIDLILPFFFTYRDGLGREVASLPRIAKHYICSSFFINLFACCPPEFAEWIIQGISGNRDEGETNLHRGVRFFKMGRTARIMRLFRLLRIFKVLEESAKWRWFQNLKGVRVLKFVITLFWVVHLAACGWYLCAALHENPEATWPFREFDAEALRVADAGPLRSWMVSYYFCLTVFTTVGFGDISPQTTGEIVYVCIVMCMGSVINGLVMSEIITILTKSGKIKLHVEEQEKLVKEFSGQTQLRHEAQDWLKQWIASRRAVHHAHDREKMLKLLIGSSFPREILGKMPGELYHGRLIKNRFITIMKRTRRKDWPVQLPLFVGIIGNWRKYDTGEIVYYASDHPWNVFLVLKGVFAHVAAVVDKASDKQTELRTSPSKLLQRHVGSLHPCYIYAFGNYFGDEEIALKRRHRRSSIRCESPGGGEVVVLQKNDFESLTREFPDMAHLWHQAALRREKHRERCVKRLAAADRHGNEDYTGLAARQIQAFFRKCLDNSRLACTPSFEAARRNALGLSTADVSMMLGSPRSTAASSPRTPHIAGQFSLLSAEVAELKATMALLMQGQSKLQASVHALVEERRPRQKRNMKERSPQVVGI